MPGGSSAWSSSREAVARLRDGSKRARWAHGSSDRRRWLSSRLGSGGVGGDLDDEIGVESGGDSFEQRDGGDDAAGLEPGQGGLGHVGPSSELGLGQTEGQAALT